MNVLNTGAQNLRLRGHNEENDRNNKYLRNTPRASAWTASVPSFARTHHMNLRAETLAGAIPPSHQHTITASIQPPLEKPLTSQRTSPLEDSPKRKMEGHESDETAKRVKTDTISFDRHAQGAIEHICDQHIVRGGFGGQLLEISTVISALPNNFEAMSHTHPTALKYVQHGVAGKELQQSLDHNESKLKALEKALAQTNTSQQETTVERPPSGDAEFLRWAAVQIEGYTKGAARRLKILATAISNPATKKDLLRSALVLLCEHLARLQQHLEEASKLHESLEKGGLSMGGATKHLEMAARELRSRRDLFRARVEEVSMAIK